MKHLTLKTLAIGCMALLTTAAHADNGKNDSIAQRLDMENGVIPIADDRGFTLQSNDGSFVFKP